MLVVSGLGVFGYLKAVEAQRQAEEARVNLANVRRVRALSQLVQQTGGIGQVEVRLITFERCSDADCLLLPGEDGSGYRRRPETLPLSVLPGRDRNWQVGELLTFEIKNNSAIDRYIYLFEFSPSGQFHLVFPAAGIPAAAARLKGNERRSLQDEDIAILLDQGGTEDLLVIVADQPINLHLSEQDRHDSRPKGSSRGNPDPVEILLSEVIVGSPTGSPMGVGKAGFGIQWFSFEVQAVGR